MYKNSPIEDLFFQLLQIAVGNPFDGTMKISDEEWRAIYDIASKQSLVSVILHAVDKLDKSNQNLPKDIVLQWIGESEQIRQRNLRVNQQCEQLSSWFKGKGFSSCVLKGQGAAQLYLQPETRQAGDIDIWVDGDRDEVVNILREQFIGVSYVDYVNCHAGFFTDTEVEVHFRPTWMYNPFVNRKIQGWIRDNKDEQMANQDIKLGFGYPLVKFNLVFSLIHIYRHVFLEGIGLRQLTDYFFILTHSSEQERKDAFMVLQSFKMKRFVGALMYVMKRVFALDEQFLLCNPSIADGEFLLSEILRGGNFGKYDDRNVYVSDEKIIKRGLNNWKRNLRYLKYYPSEVIWMPVWKVWHWCWRKFKGYL